MYIVIKRPCKFNVVTPQIRTRVPTKLCFPCKFKFFSTQIRTWVTAHMSCTWETLQVKTLKAYLGSFRFHYFLPDGAKTRSGYLAQTRHGGPKNTVVPRIQLHFIVFPMIPFCPLIPQPSIPTKLII